MIENAMLWVQLPGDLVEGELKRTDEKGESVR